MHSALNYFVSYAHKDRAQVDRLMDLLCPRLHIAAAIDFNEWNDSLIPVGQGWREAIDQAMQHADFGLLLLSPEFFASAFITGTEIPHFLPVGAGSAGDTGKPVVPVGLKPVPLDGSAKLGGVEQLQVFRDREGRWFSETRGHTRDAYADQLVVAMLAKLGAVTP